MGATPIRGANSYNVTFESYPGKDFAYNESDDEMKFLMPIDETNLEIVVALHAFFDDFEKMKHWLTTKNLSFGDSRPIDIINRGRGHKVLYFIKTAIDENDDGGYS